MSRSKIQVYMAFLKFSFSSSYLNKYVQAKKENLSLVSLCDLCVLAQKAYKTDAKSFRTTHKQV